MKDLHNYIKQALHKQYLEDFMGSGVVGIQSILSRARPRLSAALVISNTCAWLATSLKTGRCDSTGLRTI